MASKKHSLLFVDDEEDIISALYDTFIDDYTVFKTTNPKEAIDIVKKEDIAVVISDQRMPEMTGSELLAEIYEIKPETIRILLTGYADITAAIDAINKGSIHKYVEKPWDDEGLIDMVAGLVEIYEESQEQLSVLSSVNDIVARESSFNVILNNIKEAVCALNKDGTVYFANTGALQILGYATVDDIASDKVFNIEDSELEDFRKEFESNNKVKGKIVTATGKGSAPIDVLLTPIFEQEDKRMVGVVFQGI